MNRHPLDRRQRRLAELSKYKTNDKKKEEKYERTARVGKKLKQQEYRERETEDELKGYGSGYSI